MRSKVWLAAPVLLAHAEVTEYIKYFSMGPNLRHPAVTCVFVFFFKTPQHGVVVNTVLAAAIACKVAVFT